LTLSVANYLARLASRISVTMLAAAANTRIAREKIKELLARFTT